MSSSYCGIMPGASERAQLVDARMDWPEGLTLGRLVDLWGTTQNRGMEVIGRREARLLLKTRGAEGDKLLEQLCHKDIHFLELSGEDDVFHIVGNAEQIRKIEVYRTRASKGGFGKAEKDRDRKSASSSASSTPEALLDFEQAETVISTDVDFIRNRERRDRDLAAERCFKHASSIATSVPTTTTTTKLDKENSPDGERGRPGRPRAPYADFLSVWNANRGTLAGINEITDGRKTKIRARWAEKPELAYWEGCVRRMAASTFCCESGWATFDWLVKNDTNHTKVAAGNYDNRDAAGSERDPYEWMKFLSPEERARLDADEKKREAAHGQS